MSALEQALNAGEEIAFEKMGTPDLRKEVRNRGLANGSIVANARKKPLIALLKGEFTSLEAAVEADELEKRVTQPNKPASQSAPKPAADPLADMLAQALAGRLQMGMDEDRVIELIQEHAKIEKVVHNIQLKGAPDVQLEEDVHYCFEKVLKLVYLGLPVLLVGPAGTGKTTLAGQVAKALGRRFSFNSMSAGCSESHLIGRTLPDSEGNWSYKPSPFVATYQKGGVHLFDEIDAADPNLMVVINAALANGQLAIPFEDMVIDRHEDTAIIAAANTFGTGANRQYCGRNALDAATLDRFSVSTVEVGYDETLEKKLVYQILDDQKALDLLSWAWAIREKIDKAGLRRIMSTRSILNMAKRMAVGDKMKELADDYFAGWSADEVERVR